MARKSTSYSKQVFEERLRNDINSLIRSELKDPRLLLLTITRVELNADYSIANVYWDTFESEKRGDVKEALGGTAGRLRSLLAKTLNVRHTPALNFFYDSQYEDELRIEKLLQDTDID